MGLKLSFFLFVYIFIVKDYLFSQNKFTLRLYDKSHRERDFYVCHPDRYGSDFRGIS